MPSGRWWPTCSSATGSAAHRRAMRAAHMVNACCYALRTGCAWRLLPKTFPPWQAIYKSFSRWAAAGMFEAMHDRLRQQWRDRMGKAPEPTAAIIDAQSTRSTAQGGNTGFDAGKKVKGRKRHLVVDTLGLLLAVTRHRRQRAGPRRGSARRGAGLRQGPRAEEALRRRRLRRQVRRRPSKRPTASAWRSCAIPATAAPAPGKTLSSRCGPRSLPRASSCRPSAGLSSALMPGTSARAASWPTMIDPIGPRSHGSGWPKRVSSQPDWRRRSFRLHPLKNRGGSE